MGLHASSSTVGTCAAAVLMVLTAITQATAQNAPGGWIENQGIAPRTRWSASQIQSFIPSTRGAFTIPTPYNTRAIRITDASDCGGADCLFYVGYAYWRNTNNHVGSNEMLIFINLDPQRGGSGATLFKYNKVTEAVTKVGPLFPAGSKFNGYGGNDWYFSATMPTKLYLTDGPKMLRYDVISKQFETVFDITAQFGTNRTVFQTHASNDDKVFSATLQVTNTGEYLGCFVYSALTGQYRYYPKQGTLDECHLDKSGRYLMISQNVDGRNGLESLFIDLQTGAQNLVLDENGGLGHSDMGYGYAVGADNWNALANAAITFSFTPTFVVKGPAVFHSINWNTIAINHISHANAKPGLPMSQQFACGSNADDSTPVQHELICFRLDGSSDQLVVAPLMSDLNAPGGIGGAYGKYPKGNLDITGQYFIWTANLAGNRLDAFLVKVPSQLLVAPSNNPPPAAPVNLRIN
jgi:hypothetical protein